MKLHYFGVWAKGPAAGLALMHHDLEWEGISPANWKEFKPLTPFGELPVLEVEGVGLIGHEMAILNYIERASAFRHIVVEISRANFSPRLSEGDLLASQQLLCEAEDVYQKLVKFQDTLHAKDKCTAETLALLWSSADTTVNNRAQGLRVHLGHLEQLCKGDSYTESGFSIGECKLFASLHALKMIQDTVLDDFPKVLAFYARFAAHPKTQAFVDFGGDARGKFPEPLKQYFV